MARHPEHIFRRRYRLLHNRRAPDHPFPGFYRQPTDDGLAGCKGKQIFRTNFYTIAAGCTFINIHYGQPMRIHMDRIEIADFLTITMSQATPETSLATSRYKRSRRTRRQSLVRSPVSGNIRPAGTCETSDLSFFCSKELRRGIPQWQYDRHPN